MTKNISYECNLCGSNCLEVFGLTRNSHDVSTNGPLLQIEKQNADIHICCGCVKVVNKLVYHRDLGKNK